MTELNHKKYNQQQLIQLKSILPKESPKYYRSLSRKAHFLLLNSQTRLLTYATTAFSER